MRLQGMRGGNRSGGRGRHTGSPWTYHGNMASPAPGTPRGRGGRGRRGAPMTMFHTFDETPFNSHQGMIRTRKEKRKPQYPAYNADDFYVYGEAAQVGSRRDYSSESQNMEYEQEDQF